MIEPHRARKVRRYIVSSIVDEDIVGVNPSRSQHGSEQRRLVFAIPVTVCKDILCGMGLEAPDTDLDCHIANAMLDIGRQTANFLHWVIRAGYKCSGFIANPGRDFAPV